MSTLLNRITGLVEEILTPDLFIVHVHVKEGRGDSRVKVLIDGDNGITIDECARISRQLGGQIEESNIIKTKYNLEISSPGIDQPLALKRQYVKNVGRDLAVTIEGSEKLKGRLVDVGEEKIKLVLKSKKESKEIEVPFDQIIKANVLVSFN
ncbi:MAG: ribosome maturation factor RimP [Cyclobacteriaceae bacterium]